MNNELSQYQRKEVIVQGTQTYKRNSESESISL